MSMENPIDFQKFYTSSKHHNNLRKVLAEMILSCSSWLVRMLSSVSVSIKFGPSMIRFYCLKRSILSEKN